jgi:hypothetical protein
MCLLRGIVWVGLIEMSTAACFTGFFSPRPAYRRLYCVALSLHFSFFFSFLGCLYSHLMPQYFTFFQLAFRFGYPT